MFLGNGSWETIALLIALGNSCYSASRVFQRRKNNFFFHSLHVGDIHQPPWSFQFILVSQSSLWTALVSIAPNLWLLCLNRCPKYTPDTNHERKQIRGKKRNPFTKIYENMALTSNRACENWYVMTFDVLLTSMTPLCRTVKQILGLCKSDILSGPIPDITEFLFNLSFWFYRLL